MRRERDARRRGAGDAFPGFGGHVVARATLFRAITDSRVVDSVNGATVEKRTWERKPLAQATRFLVIGLRTLADGKMGHFPEGPVTTFSDEPPEYVYGFEAERTFVAILVVKDEKSAPVYVLPDDVVESSPPANPIFRSASKPDAAAVKTLFGVPVVSADVSVPMLIARDAEGNVAVSRIGSKASAVVFSPEQWARLVEGAASEVGL